MPVLRRRLTALAAAAALLVAACDDSADTPGFGADEGFTPPPMRTTAVAGGFGAPLAVVAPPGDGRVFVVERPGRVWRIDKGRAAEPYLDVSDRISEGGERGLLGLAFHPGFAANGRLFLNYTDPAGDTRVVELTVDSAAERVDAGSERLLLSVAQPFANHNGGNLVFGPDGLLYIGLGDGGSGGDPMRNGQNAATLLGAMLRIDVDRRDGGRPYGIPAGNPFADGAGGAPEVVATGLRNPWRYSIDPVTGDLWIGDVGQDSREEIDRVALDALPGANFGWSAFEGSLRHDDGVAPPDPRVPPVAEYGHDVGCSVTGGVVYRGGRIPGLAGRYLFADYCTGRVWSLAAEGDPGRAAELTEALGGPFPELRSFGVDARGEVYLAAGDAVRRIDPAEGWTSYSPEPPAG